MPTWRFDLRDGPSRRFATPPILTGELMQPFLAVPPPRSTVLGASAVEQVDVPYQYLTFFMEDDEELKRIGERPSISGCDVVGNWDRLVTAVYLG